MLPLKVAFLWHQHQPYYKLENEFVLPWVRMHGVKDYFDLPEILYEFPEIKQTFNFAPSLNKQINEYISGQTIDRVLYLSNINANELSVDNKKEMIELFFKCQKDNLIDKHPRFKELYGSSRDLNYALNNFKVNDWRDLQVWYNLTWVGYFSSQTGKIKRLLDKQKNYTEEEKHLLLDYHTEILKSIVPQMHSLVNLDQVEISVSPMYHPILPLLINSESAKEGMPNANMPDPIFKRKEDAKVQIQQGINYFDETFGFKPNGMWPSEGSVSDEALELISDSGISWIATDEDILLRSKSDLNRLEKFFPRKFNINGKKISVLFRDHGLSDKIGFEYSKWNPQDAANDFVNILNNIRNELIAEYSEEALKYAVVPVILDGENCWEFYQDNGIPFLRNLYKLLSENDKLKTVTCSEAVETDNYLGELDHIFAGSWINADFNIWIGDKEDITGWNLLGKTRAFVENNRSKYDDGSYKESMEHIYIAEGSDWFWWYGPEHYTEDKSKFDRIFRWHLSEVFRLAGEEIPSDLKTPVNSENTIESIQKPDGVINPEINGKSDSEGWEKAGSYTPVSTNSAMHQVSKKIKNLNYGTDYKHIFIRMNFNDSLNENDKLIIQIDNPFKLKLEINKIGLVIKNENASLELFEYALNECLDLKILAQNIDFEKNVNIKAKFILSINGNNTEYPTEGMINLKLN